MRLTAMNKACFRQGIQLLHEGRAPRFIFSNAKFSPSELEVSLKRAILREEGISDRAALALAAVEDTSDEVMKARAVLQGLGAKSVIVVANQHHMRRVLRWFRLLAPDLSLFYVSVACGKYERQRHPWLAWRVVLGSESLWALWNLIFYLLIPVVAVVRQRKTVRARAG